MKAIRIAVFVSLLAFAASFYQAAYGVPGPAPEPAVTPEQVSRIAEEMESNTTGFWSFSDWITGGYSTLQLLASTIKGAFLLGSTVEALLGVEVPVQVKLMLNLVSGVSIVYAFLMIIRGVVFAGKTE